MRKAVRTNIKYGADWIKVLASAGVLSEEEAVGAPQYSQEELNAIVAEATTWGRKVAAHAHGAEAIKRATRAGVASIEHGGLVDEEGVRLMKEHGTYLVPDIYTDAYILEHGKEIGLPDKMIEKERQLRKAQNVNWRRAIAAGVKMAFGTDAGVYPHGTNAQAVQVSARARADAAANHPNGDVQRRRSARLVGQGGNAGAGCLGGSDRRSRRPAEPTSRCSSGRRS